MRMTRLKTMAGFFGFLIGSLLVSATDVQAARAPYQVLITYFEPFQGGSENSGDRIAHLVEALLRQRAKKFQKIDVKLCVLPVQYRTVLSRLQDCLNESSHWSLVLGLGQGFDFRIEELGRLRTANIADDSQVSSGPSDDEVGLNATEDLIQYSRRALDRFLDLRVKKPRILSFTRSDDAGSFVCNYYAMRAAHRLSEQKIAFAFFHVPSPHYLYEMKTGWDEVAEDLADFIQIASRTRPSTSG